MTNSTVDAQATPLPAGAPAPDFALQSTPDQTGRAVRLSRPAGRPRVLSRRTGARSAAIRWRSTTSAPRVPALRRGAARDLRRRRLVPPRVRQGPEAALPAARRLRAQGRGRAPLRRLPDQDGTSERALFVIDGDGVDPLELRLAGRRQPRRRRDPARARRPRRRRPLVTHDHVGARAHAAGQRESATTSQGPADAPVTLVEYGDYECPYCGAAYPIVKEVQARLGDAAALRVPQLPAHELHPHAEHAAEAAEAAGAQGKFWEMHDRLYEHQRRLERRRPARLRRAARARRRARSTRSWPSTSTPSACARTS